MFISSIGSYGLTLDYPNWSLRKFFKKIPDLLLVNLLLSIIGSFFIFYLELIPFKFIPILLIFWILAPLNSFNKALETDGHALSLAQYKTLLNLFALFIKLSFLFLFYSSTLIFFVSVFFALFNFYFLIKINLYRLRKIFLIFTKKKIMTYSFLTGNRQINYRLLISSLCGIFFLRADAFLIENWNGVSEQIIFEYLICFPLVDTIFLYSSGLASQTWKKQFENSSLPDKSFVVKSFLFALLIIFISPIYFFFVTGKFSMNPVIIFLALSAFVHSYGVFQTPIVSKRKDFSFQLLRTILGVFLYIFLFLFLKNHLDPVFLSVINLICGFFIIFLLPLATRRHSYIF